MSFASPFLKHMTGHIKDHKNIDILAFKRLYIYAIIIISVLLLWITTILSFYSGESSIAPTLFIASCFFIVAGITLYIKNHLLLQIQYVSLTIAGLLGIALLTHTGSYNPIYSLVWFIMFTSMVMFTLGLYHGTFFFSVYFIVLIVLLFSPYDMGVSEKLIRGARIRLLVAMFGTFLYSWGAEYLRHKTQLALTTLLLETERLAHTDNLTGLKNRENFQSILSNTICASEEKSQPFALFLMDLDHFKNVNDTYGHDMGDLILKDFSEALTLQKRNGDSFFRWGGEEFVMILPGVTAEQAYSSANRMRESVAAKTFKKNDVKISYTVSIGIYSGQGKEGWAMIMKTADINLYKAKKAGRNCVVI